MQTVQKTQKGFTLIELMIVVAIIGILAAVALPAYQDYVAKSKTTSVVATMAALKTDIFDYYTAEGSMPGADEIKTGGAMEGAFNTISSIKNGTMGTVPASAANATSVTIPVALKNVNGNINGKTIEFTYADLNGGLSFKCNALAADATALKNKYLPTDIAQTNTKLTVTLPLQAVNGNINGKKMVFTYEDAAGGLVFTCAALAADKTTLKNKYLPKECHS